MRNDPSADNDNQIGLFDIDEVRLGRRLGSGAFSDVYEVKGFHHVDSRNKRLKRAHAQGRQQMMEAAPQGLYAVKFLKKELLIDTERFELAAHDLEFEGDLLSRLDHPNILKVRGWAANGFNAYFKMNRHDGYFLIMDRLQKTLRERIQQWRAQIMETRQRSRKMFLEQLEVALDIACALEYLHENRIIFRDLKPENVGLDSQGEGKLFDFGLARELPKGDMEDAFQMSGEVGTLRYMAPEVCENRPYNTKADVYSFSHVFWEMLTLQKPYVRFTKPMHNRFVVKRGGRPDLDPSWPVGIQKLLARSWHHDITERPTMKEVRKMLEIEIDELQGGSRRNRLPLVPTEPVKAKDMFPKPRKHARRGSLASLASRAA